MNDLKLRMAKLICVAEMRVLAKVGPTWTSTWEKLSPEDVEFYLKVAEELLKSMRSIPLSELLGYYGGPEIS